MSRMSITWLLLSGFLFTTPSTLYAQNLELLASFDPDQDGLPESIALDAEGNRYFSMSNAVHKQSPDGEIHTFGTLPLPVFALGVTVGPDGCVYTVSTSLDPEVEGAFAWRICEEEEVEQLAALDHQGGPNDLAFDAHGNLFITDTFMGQVWKLSPKGDPEVWVQDPLLAGDPEDPALVVGPMGANGIAFDRKQHNLYVGNLDRGCIVRIGIGKYGEAKEIADFSCDPHLRGADGMAFDVSGKLLVAVGAQNRIVEVDHQGDVHTVVEGDLLRGPSSVAFGTTSKDKHSVYITNLDFLRGFGIEPGPAEPGLLRMTECRPKGLPLP